MGDSGRAARGLTGPAIAGARGRPNDGLTRKAGLSNGSGASRGAGLTNGNGFTNGGGRTNGGGFTNGSGRTNGGGFTNGSGRTNGSGGRFSGGHARRAAARRSRRRTGATLAVALLVAVSLGVALGLSGAAPEGLQVDGSLADWGGAMHTAPAGGLLAQFGIADGPAGPVAALTFLQPLEARQDVWVFVDTDMDGSTGYYTGSLGADAAVVVHADGGRALSATQMRYTGTDHFDLNGLVATGPAQAALRGSSLEVTLPGAPRALEVAVATLDSAKATAAFDPEGSVVTLGPPSAALSGEVRNGIRVDGDFSDWADVPTTQEPASPELPGRLDIVSTAAIGDGASAEFLVDTRAGILTGTVPLRASPIVSGSSGSAPAPFAPPRRVAGTDLLEVYLDTDNNPATGVPAFGLGAEYLLRVEGVRGVVVASDFFAAEGTGGWQAADSSAEAAASGGSVEAAVAAGGLVGADARFVLQGFDGGRDVSTVPTAVGAVSGSLAPAGDSGPSPGAAAQPADLNPIPEVSDVAVVAAGVLVIFTVRRLRRKERAAGA